MVNKPINTKKEVLQNIYDLGSYEEIMGLNQPKKKPKKKVMNQPRRFYPNPYAQPQIIYVQAPQRRASRRRKPRAKQGLSDLDKFLLATKYARQGAIISKQAGTKVISGSRTAYASGKDRVKRLESGKGFFGKIFKKKSIYK